MATQSLHASLPTELWYPIISGLPSLDQRTCLSVSKTFHDIASKYVFSHVAISLGLWRPFEYEIEYEDLSPEEKVAMKRQANASYEILRHIMDTPDFARKVKKLCVRAHSTDSGDMQIAIRFLADALQAIPDLRGFEWHGISPIIPTEIVEAVVRSARNTLQVLNLPPELPEGLAMLLPSLNCVRSLTIRDFEFSPGEIECSMILAVIEANLDTLGAVCLTGAVWEPLLPLSRFMHLHELELIAVYDYDGLGELISCCTLLRSFALMPAEQEFIPILRAHSHALPNLDAFKLRALDYSGDDVAALAEFLRPKRHLRLLDVTMHIDSRRFGSDPQVSPVLLPLLQIMPTLPDLRVVGLSFHVGAVRQDHTLYMERYLPRNLTALLFWAEISSASVVPAKHWTDLFASYKSLQYLHIVPDYYDVLNLQADILHDPPPNLELLGYGAQMHPMGRDPATGAVVVHPRWPYPKVHFRTAEDFGNADWEWLLRHHGYDDEESFMHNADSFR
ncbi:hypothetical protein V8D89_009168 [Ganoderma adspersum]